MGSQLDSVVEQILEVARDPRPETEPISNLTTKFTKLMKGLPRKDLDRALLSLVAGVEAPHPQIVGHIAWLGGCLVEEGADPLLLTPALVRQVPRALEDAARFVEAIRPLAELEPDPSGLWVGERFVSRAQFEQVLDADPPAAQSFKALDSLCQALITALSRSPGLLKESAPVLRTALGGMQDSTQYTYFLDRLMRVPIDEEWLIIDAIHGRGFMVDVSGVANAFQVYALIHDSLLRGPRGARGWSAPVSGPAVAKKTLAVATGDGPQAIEAGYSPSFTLFRWTAVTRERPVPDDSAVRDWYSNSAVPAELSRHDGRRVGVIGTFNVRMDFGVSREFAGLQASVELTRELSRAEVGTFLDGFTKSPSPGHPVPGVGWA